LDEIGDMDLLLQAKILRVIQERQFQRVGGTKILEADIRLIAATHLNLEEKIKDKTFRNDLYYRLNVVPIKCPPLRNRKSDIPLLVNHFLEKYALEHKKNVKKVPDAIVQKMIEHNWPGNVRELASFIERAVVLCKGSEITLEDLQFETISPEKSTEIRLEKISEGFHDIREESDVELGHRIFKFCLKNNVVENDPDNKEYILLNIMLHPLGRKPSDAELAAIEYERGTQKLTQAVSRLRRKMKDKKIAYTIKVKDGSPRIVPATDFD